MRPRALWDDLLFQARLRPGGLAVFAVQGPIVYRTLVQDVEALATELLEQGVVADDMVGIDLPTGYLHLLTILALDRLGIASMSFPSGQPAPAAACRMFHVTIVVSNHAPPADAICRWVALPEPLTRRQPDPLRLAAAARTGDPLVRVVWSSGTGGGAKGAALTRSIQAQRLGHRRLLQGLGTRTRYLVGLAFTGPAYIIALATLSAGGALILPPPKSDLVALANLMGATIATATPAMLTELVAGPEAQVRRFETLECLEAVGAHLPRQVAQDVLRRVTPNLRIHYGTTEVAQVASVDAAACLADTTAAGFPLPWVELEIVDKDDRPLAPEREGVVRIRTPAACAGYYQNPETTQRSFRDGWFYPGDVGVIGGDGMLRLTGRTEDLIVRDGETISPVPIEEAIRGLPGVRDVAVFPLRRPDGVPEICAALVLDEGASAEAIHTGARAALGDHTPARMFRVEALPRNPNGKVLRTQLVDWAVQRMGGRGTS